MHLATAARSTLPVWAAVAVYLFSWERHPAECLLRTCARALRIAQRCSNARVLVVAARFHAGGILSCLFNLGGHARACAKLWVRVLVRLSG